MKLNKSQQQYLLNRLIAGIVSATREEENHYIQEQAQMGRTLIPTKQTESLEEYVTRLQKFNAETGHILCGTHGKAHIFIAGGEKDIIEAALKREEDLLYGGPDAAIWTALSIIQANIEEQHSFAEVIAQRPLPVPQKTPLTFLTSLDKIERAVILATNLHEDIFINSQEKTGHIVFGPTHKENLNDFVNRLWEAHETGLPVCGTFDKLHFTSTGATSKEDMLAKALAGRKKLLETDITAPIWRALKIAAHIRSNNLPILDQMGVNVKIK